MKLPLRPELILWGVLDLAWLLRVAPNGGKRTDFQILSKSMVGR